MTEGTTTVRQAPRSSTTVRRTEYIGALVAVIVGSAGLFMTYHWFLLGGFVVYQGDVGDGRFTAAVATHWAAPFRFAGGPRDLGIYFPSTSTLGYSDTMFMFGMLAAPLIHIGMYAQEALQWAYIGASAAGYAAAVILLRLLRVPWVVAIPAAFLVVFSNAMQLASLHPQLLSLTMVPVICLFGLISLRASTTFRAMAWGVASGLVYAVMSYTSFFAGWTTLLTGAVALILMIILRLIFRQGLAWPTSTQRWSLLGMLVGALTVLPALLWTYGDVLRAGQSRTSDEVATYLLTPLELVNVSGLNVLWGSVMSALGEDSERVGEWWYAPTPLVLGLALAMVALGVGRFRRMRLSGQVGVTVLLAGFAALLLPVRVGSLTPWAITQWIPGAGAIRAVGRLHVVVAITLALGIALVLGDWLASRPRRPWVFVLVAAVGLLLMVEQPNRHVRQQTSLAESQPSASIPSPPADCTSFVIVPPFPDELWYATMTEAQLLAQRIGIPTWNGYSGGEPKGWDLWMNTDHYDRSVEEWRARNGITDYCTVNLVTGTWTEVRTA